MAQEIILIGAGLILIGFLLVFFGSSTKAEAGGVVFIGPIPIAFGSLNKPENAKTLWVIGIALFLLFLFAASKMFKSG